MARSYRAGQTGTAEICDLPRRAAGRGILHGPARHIDGRIARIEQLNEIVLERRTAIAAAAVNLTNDDT